MNRTFLASLGLALCVAPVAGVPAASATPENLLPNGGFEKGMDGWKVEDESGGIKLEIDGKERAEGKSSLHFVKKDAPGLSNDRVVAELKRLPAGKKVVVSAKVKGKGLKNTWLKFFVFDAKGEVLGDDCDVARFPGTFEWKGEDRAFTLPKEAVRAEVRFCMFMGGEAWLDDVKVMGDAAASREAVPTRTEKRKPLDAATRKWLDGNAVKVRTLDFPGPLDDLAPLKEILKDARIVQLGENTHGDGACFQAKARLVRFLHEEMGFEVLAFESGLYECDRANELLRKGDADGAMEGSIFGIWRVGQVKPLFRYLAERAKSEKPLLLAGFDCRASGSLAGRLWDEAPGADADHDAVKRLDALMEEQGDRYAPTEKDLAAGLAALGRIRKAAEAAPEPAFLLRCLDGWKMREAFERSKSDKSLGEYGSNNLRDAAMAENLRWLAEVRHPGRRIVCWGATFHLARGLAGVKMEGNAKHYEGCRNMGQGTFETFGKAVHTVGFAAYGGKAGSFSWKADLKTPRDGSVEDTLYRYAEPLLFVDLRREGPFGVPLRMAPMSYSRDIEARWPDVLDAVFYIEEMTPAR
jgi:erythromycin esterase